MDTAEDFRLYVAARQRALLRTAWLLTGDWATAEDLVQTALIRAWPHWGRLQNEAGADGYVRRIMVNKSLDWRNRRWTGEVPTGMLPERETVDSGDAAAAHLVLLSAIRTLPPRQRAVIALRYLDDLSEAETAAAMGCSIGTVKSQASKALASLRRHPDLIDLQVEEGAR